MADVEHTLNIITDTGIIVLFNPYGLSHRKTDVEDWFADDNPVLIEARSGNLVPILTFADGLYVVKITADPFFEVESAQVVVSTASYWLNVTHNLIYVGGYEDLPAGGYEAGMKRKPKPGFIHNGLVSIANGRYRTSIYGLYDEEDETERSIDYIVHLTPLINSESPPTPTEIIDLDRF